MGLLWACVFTFAKPISLTTAQQVAENAFAEFQGSSIRLYLRSVAEGENGQYYSIYSPAPKEGTGFIIIAGDDASIPVLAYSLEKDYSNNPSPSFEKWMEWYRIQIQEIQALNLSASPAIEAAWKRYLKPGTHSPIQAARPIAPLLATEWNQAPYYNTLCPYDNSFSERTVTGCVATAMAQIMKFWEYPAQGSGNHSYNHDSYGTLSANFSAVSYDWNSMPNSINTSNSAIATLMYHCGVSVEMNYGVGSQGGSGAYVITNQSPVTHCSEYAFRTYFNYDENLVGEERANFSQSQWIQKLKDELNNGRPLLYAGFGQGGHAFVCDGYDNNDYFHFNWGWGGVYDGYFSINSLNPGTGGAGAGAGTYNNGQQAIFNLKPKAGGGGGGGSELPVLYSNITIDPDPVDYLQAFNATVDIANLGTTAITGDFGAAVFNSAYEFIDFVEIISNATIQPNMYGTATFSTNGMSSLVPGAYVLGIYFMEPGGDWAAVGNGNYSNFLSFNVVGEQGDIRLYAAVDIDPNPVKQDQSLAIHFDMANYNQFETFTGTVSIDLHQSDGTWIRELSKQENLTLPALTHFQNGLTFNLTNGLPDDPGTYKIQIWYQPDGGNWALMGSGDYENPVSLTIVTPALNPDQYEANNTEGNARIMPVTFTGNTAKLTTTASNIHNGTDLDYYKIVLEPGFDYTITGRLHDMASSGNGNDYTCDVMMSYQKSAKWSDYYDDVMPGNIVVNDGGTLIFSVSPFFTGQTGTYLLDMSISRVPRSGTFLIKPSASRVIEAYPNPVTQGNTLVLELAGSLKIESLQCLSIDGKEFKLSSVRVMENRVEVDTDLPAGVYFMRVYHNMGISSIKVVVRQ